MANGFTVLVYFAALLTAGAFAAFYYAVGALMKRIAQCISAGAAGKGANKQINISQTFRKQFANSKAVH